MLARKIGTAIREEEPVLYRVRASVDLPTDSGEEPKNWAEQDKNSLTGKSGETDPAAERKTFSQKVLVQYMTRHPKTTANWKITANPRGAFVVPNAGHEVHVPCGTIQIEKHMRKAMRACDPFDIDAELDVVWPSLAPGQRYAAVLYIEKEGFHPMMHEVRIGERFDVALLSCKGQSVVAARMLVDEFCHDMGGVPLLVVHDFDKSGFEISQRLTTVSERDVANDTVKYHFQNDIDVTDLGLRLTDVQAYGLADEDCSFNLDKDFPSDSICTEEEKEYLRAGRRVELNAFTAPQFIEWIETKLAERGLGGLIPDDEVLEDAYRRALAIAEINAGMEKARESLKNKVKVQGDLMRNILKAEIEKRMERTNILDGADRRVSHRLQ